MNPVEREVETRELGGTIEDDVIRLVSNDVMTSMRDELDRMMIAELKTLAVPKELLGLPEIPKYIPGLKGNPKECGAAKWSIVVLPVVKKRRRLAQ